MGGNSRKFKKAEKSKVKLKGAKLPTGTNVTKTNFKVRKIVIPDQLKQRNLSETAVLSNKSLSLKDCLAKLKPNNASSRCDGMRGVREIISKMPSEVQRLLSSVIKDVTSLAVDLERDVRRDCYKTLGCVFAACGQSSVLPFFDVLLSFLRCAMTHIQSRIQEDSLLLMDVLLQYLPELILVNRDKILPQFLDMISKLTNEAKPGRTLTINLDKQSTSTRWRAKVLMRLAGILKILIDSKLSKDSEKNKPVDVSQEINMDKDNPFASKVPEYQPNKAVQINYVFDNTTPMFLPVHKGHLYVTCPMDCLFRKSTGAEKGLSLGDRVDDGRKLKMYIEMLMPILFESWLEVRPSGTGNETVEEHALSQEAASTLDLLLTIFIQLWNLTGQYCADTNNDDMKRWFRKEYSVKFGTHILAGFPYYQTGAGKNQSKGAKVNLPNAGERTVDDNCYRHNFNICFFYCCLHEQFRGEKKNVEAYAKVVEYIKRCVLNWKFRGAEATNLLLQVLRYMLLETNCLSVNQETRTLLQTLLEVYITAKLPQDIRNRILVLFCDIIVRNDSLWRKYGQELFTLWLKMLPNLLCKPMIDFEVLKALLCLAQRNNTLFLDVLEANAEQIVANLGTIRVTNETHPGEGLLLICSLLFYIRSNDLIKELLSIDINKLEDVSQRERLCSTLEMRMEML